MFSASTMKSKTGRMRTNARRVRGKHAKGEGTRMGSAPRLDGPVEVTAQPRPVAHVAIEEGASRWLEDALDPKKRQKPDQILEDRRKIKGIDDKPWKKTGTARTARTARSEEARVQRQSDQISNVLNQVIAGRRQLYGKMMSSAETVFKTIDTDNSGTISKVEMIRMCEKLQVPDMAEIPSDIVIKIRNRVAFDEPRSRFLNSF